MSQNLDFQKLSLNYEYDIKNKFTLTNLVLTSNDVPLLLALKKINRNTEKNLEIIITELCDTFT